MRRLLSLAVALRNPASECVAREPFNSNTSACRSTTAQVRQHRGDVQPGPAPSSSPARGTPAQGDAPARCTSALGDALLQNPQNQSPTSPHRQQHHHKDPSKTFSQAPAPDDGAREVTRPSGELQEPSGLPERPPEETLRVPASASNVPDSLTCLANCGSRCVSISKKRCRCVCTRHWTLGLRVRSTPCLCKKKKKKQKERRKKRPCSQKRLN